MLEKMGHQVDDCGCGDTASVDFPDFAVTILPASYQGKTRRQALSTWLRSHQRIRIVANKVSGVRAALVHDEVTARRNPVNTTMPACSASAPTFSTKTRFARSSRYSSAPNSAKAGTPAASTRSRKSSDTTCPRPAPEFRLSNRQFRPVCRPLHPPQHHQRHHPPQQHRRRQHALRRDPQRQLLV